MTYSFLSRTKMLESKALTLDFNEEPIILIQTAKDQLVEE